MTWVLLYLMMSVMPTVVGTPPPMLDEAACIDLVNEIFIAVAREDYERLIGALDEDSASGLRLVGELEFENKPPVLMKVLNASQHPARFRKDIRIEPADHVQIEAPGSTTRAVYRRVVLTQPYRELDAKWSPPCGDTPVELCVEFVRDEKGRLRIGLDYPFHDILYMLQ